MTCVFLQVRREGHDGPRLPQPVAAVDKNLSTIVRFLNSADFHPFMFDNIVEFQ